MTRFDDTEIAVLRFLKEQYQQHPAQRPARVCPKIARIMAQFNLTKEQCYALAARFESLGLVEWKAKEMLGEFLQIQRAILSAVEEQELGRPTMQNNLEMDVLISWSKQQSKAMASVFYDWLPKVVPGLKPWMSSKDIDKGKPWFNELQAFLGEATSCIICLTSENVRSPWIYYETGAIAAKKQEVLVCPYLVGIGTSMVKDGPLGQYQCTEANKEDTLALVKSLNNALANRHDEGLLCGNFENKWPEFKQELDRILTMEATSPAEFVETEADVVAGFKLSAEARTLLLAAASSDGHLMFARSLGGSMISAGGQKMNDQASQRSTAVWRQALTDLITHRLINSLGHQNTVFEVSAKGYEVADVLQKQSPT